MASDRGRAGGDHLGGNRTSNRTDRPVSRTGRKEAGRRGDPGRWARLGRRGFLGLGLTAAMTIADFPDWQSPAAHAAQIATAGVPLLTKSQQVLLRNPQTIAGNSTYNSGNLQVTQPGFECTIVAQVPNTATIPFLRIRLTWVDSGSASIVGETIWIQPMSQVAPGWQCNVRGPSKADLVQVSITNLEPAQTATVVIALLANSRVYTDDLVSNDPLQNSSAVVPGWTLPTLPPLAEVLGMISSQSIGASSQVTWLIPPGSGTKAVLTCNTGASTPSNVRTNLYPVPSAVFGNNPPMVPGLPVANDFAAEFVMPRAPLSLTIANLATTAIIASWSLVQEL